MPLVVDAQGISDLCVGVAHLDQARVLDAREVLRALAERAELEAVYACGTYDTRPDICRLIGLL